MSYNTYNIKIGENLQILCAYYALTKFNLYFNVYI